MTHEEIVEQTLTMTVDNQMVYDTFTPEQKECFHTNIKNALNVALTTYRAQVLEEVGREVVKMENHSDGGDDFCDGKRIGYNLALDRVLLYLSHQHPTN